MAQLEIKFLDQCTEGSFLQIQSNYMNHHKDDMNIRIMGVDSIGSSGGKEEVPVEFDIWLDVSTAIKFVKTLRTEINKIKEVNNG
ncbi:MAG TPA: hypothetical protein EYO58_01885 [Flavobacteriales bacterium]|nr:hypothetical protein [Flavobacteriales bacterium]